MPQTRILELVKQGRAYKDKQNYREAKDCFLQAASLAVDLSKSQTDEQEKYEKIARDLIVLAKEVSEKNENVEKIDKGSSEQSENIEKQPNKVTTSQADLFADHLPEEVKEYEINTKQPLEIKVGRIETGEYIWNPAELMNGIMMITGGSGSGKTEWLRSVSTEIVHRGVPVLILDLHGDIDVEIPSLAIDYEGNYGINPFDLISTDPADGGPIPQIELLINMFGDAAKDKFSSTQIALLRNVLTLTYEKVGIYHVKPETWNKTPPTFSTLEEVLYNPTEVAQTNKKIQGILSSFTQATFLAVINRLQSILTHPAFQAKYLLPLEKILEVPMRIILKDLPTIETQFVFADTLLRQLFDKVQSKGHITSDNDLDKFRLFVVIDEMKILSGNRGLVESSYNILNRLATEARKYGIGLLLASQLSHHFGRDIKANASTKLMLRPMDIDEARRAAKELEIGYEDLFDLDEPGKGFLRSTDLPDAILIQLYPSDNRPLM